jgi:hypothetical protein
MAASRRGYHHQHCYYNFGATTRNSYNNAHKYGQQYSNYDFDFDFQQYPNYDCCRNNAEYNYDELRQYDDPHHLQWCHEVVPDNYYALRYYSYDYYRKFNCHILCRPCHDNGHRDC